MLYYCVCHISIIALFYLVCSYMLCAFLFFTFTPKYFALTVAAVSAELRAVLLNKPAKLYNFYAALLILHTVANSAQNSGITSCDCIQHRQLHPTR